MATYILKIGTFITPDSDASSIGLLTQEPKNFASFLSKYFDSSIVFCSNMNAHSKYNTLQNIHFKEQKDTYDASFIDITSSDYEQLFSKIDSNDKLIIWQGMKPGNETDASMYHAYRFINAWQQLELDNEYFVMTDTRVQFLDLHAYLKTTQNEDYHELVVDSSKITMLTQAANLLVFCEKLSAMSFNMNVDYDKSLYFSNFKDIRHVPLYSLPLFTHYAHSITLHKTYTNVFMTQCINYLDDYRLKCLADLMCDSSSEHSRNAHIFSKPVANNKLLTNTRQQYKHFVMPKMHKPVHFSKTSSILSLSKYSICVAEKDYVDCDLLPNRIFEAIAAKCIPIIHKDILDSTSLYVLKTHYVKNIDKFDSLVMLNIRQLSISIDNCINN